MERRDRFLPPYISTRFTARLLTILLLITAAVSGLSAGFEISQLHVLSGIGDYADVDEETRWAYTFIRNTLLVSRLVLYGSIGFAFITWLHRCRINVRAFGCRRFRYSRIWAIIGFFIPLVNFFRPYQVVSEVWRASDPRSLETPVAWINMPVSRFVLAWWVVLLTSVFLEILAAGLITHSGVTLDDLLAARSIGVLVGITSASGAILAYHQPRRGGGERHGPLPDRSPDRARASRHHRKVDLESPHRRLVRGRDPRGPSQHGVHDFP